MSIQVKTIKVSAFRLLSVETAKTKRNEEKKVVK